MESKFPNSARVPNARTAGNARASRKIDSMIVKVEMRSYRTKAEKYPKEEKKRES
jgi:hypothetical protein